MPNDTPYTLEDFAESLIKAKQYTTLTQAMHDDLKQDILVRIHDYILAKTIAKLTDTQVKELDTLLDTNPSDEVIQNFIAKSIPNSPDFIGDTLIAFRQTYLGLA